MSVVAEGDSITNSNGDIAARYEYPALAVQLSSNLAIVGTVTAVVGSNLADLTSRAAADDALIVGGKTNVFTVLIGHNDFAGNPSLTAAAFVASLKTYCQARQTAGWKVVLLTELPSTLTNFNTWRNAVNVLIAGDTSFYNAIADVAADPDIGPDAAAANTTWYRDGTHPTGLGHGKIAPIVALAIQSLATP